MIADEKIVKVISQMGDTFKVMLSILVSLLALLLIGTMIILKSIAVL